MKYMYFMKCFVSIWNLLVPFPPIHLHTFIGEERDGTKTFRGEQGVSTNRGTKLHVGGVGKCRGSKPSKGYYYMFLPYMCDQMIRVM